MRASYNCGSLWRFAPAAPQIAKRGGGNRYHRIVEVLLIAFVLPPAAFAHRRSAAPGYPQTA